MFQSVHVLIFKVSVQREQIHARAKSRAGVFPRFTEASLGSSDCLATSPWVSLSVLCFQPKCSEPVLMLLGGFLQDSTLDERVLAQGRRLAPFPPSLRRHPLVSVDLASFDV